jgi:hypothetical protein
VSAREEYDYIALGMPMPVDVFATLGDLISKAWPGADLIADPVAAGIPEKVAAAFGGGWGSPKMQLVRIPKHRGRRVSKKEAQAIAAENHNELGDDETRLNFHGFETTEHGTSVGLSGAEELQHQLGALGLAILDQTEGAINYVEWTIIDKETDRRAVLCVARSKGQTAHALRTRAEDKIARARALLDAHDDAHGAPEVLAEVRALLR